MDVNLNRSVYFPNGYEFEDQGTIIGRKEGGLFFSLPCLGRFCGPPKIQGAIEVHP